MAFAAVISLKYTIHRLQNLINFPRITRSACDEELDSLISVLRRMDDESSRLIERSVIDELDAKIRDAVWKVEDVLDISSYHCLNISASEGGLDEKGVEQEIKSILANKKLKISLAIEYNKIFIHLISRTQGNVFTSELRCSAFKGPHWETEKGRFYNLRILLLEDIDLVHWTTEANSFQNLHYLSVRHCYKLKNIPSEIGDIHYLEMMEVDDCSPSVVASALKIKEKTKSDDLKVVINSSWNL